MSGPIQRPISSSVVMAMLEGSRGLYAMKLARPLICCYCCRCCCLFSRSTNFASSLVAYNLSCPTAFLGGISNLLYKVPNIVQLLRRGYSIHIVSEKPQFGKLTKNKI